MPLILMILGFVWWWPLGLLILGYVIAKRRRGYWHEPLYAADGTPQQDWRDGSSRWERKMGRLQQKMERVCGRMDRARTSGDWFGGGSSGNRAFDDYRTETLKRLEDEQREFKDFLGRLRFAKDRAEFDQFMTERRQRPVEPDSPIEPHA